jgi:hypothetical protein
MPRKRRTKIPPHKVYQTRIGAKPSRGLNYLIGVLSLVVLAFASSTVLKVMSGETTSLPVERSYLRVQVLNGCGVPQAAATMASIIRSVGIPDVDFDVIDEDNFETFEISATMILVRDERATSDALRLAEKLGIITENVVTQHLDDNYLGLDLTMILGKDFESIVDRIGSRSD